jgi:hypothetical protein
MPDYLLAATKSLRQKIINTFSGKNLKNIPEVIES